MQPVVVARIARIGVKVLLAFASVALLLFAVMAYWLFFYASDLPNIQAMSPFAPQAPTMIPDAYICDERTRIIAVPTSQLRDLRNALLAAEGDVDPRNAISRLYHDLVGEPGEGKRYGAYSLHVSRQLFCNHHGGMLRREISELRTSVQLERHFTTNQLLDIYLNRAYFGPGIYGIGGASEHYLAKSANGLSTPEAALLVGLIKSPRRLSPQLHPDRALVRRNEVIDAMASRGCISSEQAEQAKRAPLGAVAEDSARPHS
jgi:membrane carboxypeptidase/penicillin-binding protein